MTDNEAEIIKLIDEYAGTAADTAWVKRHCTVLEYNISVKLQQQARDACIAALSKHFSSTNK